MKVKAHKESNIMGNIAPVLMSVYVIVGATLALQFLIVRMQTEKVNKIRDFMRMMGMADTPYYLSCFLFYGASSLIMTILLTLAVTLLALTNTSFIVLFIDIYLLMMTVFPFAVLVK